MVVLQKSPTVFLVALFVRGFYLEITVADHGKTTARYLHGARCISQVLVGSA